jgi:hypothetical protein
VVRRIFELFTAGDSPREIAKRLNAEHVPGPGGRPGGTRRSAVRPIAARASSTTRSTSAASNGTAAPTSRTHARARRSPGRTRASSGRSCRYPSCAS